MNALNFEKYNKLTTLLVIRKINRLESTHGFQCNYRPMHLNLLSFYGNIFNPIEPYYFPQVAVKKFSLVNNKIETIKKNAFTHHKVEIFDLSDNLIEDLENESLPSTEVTKMITLKNNKLTYIEPGSFTPSLESLSLDQNNFRYIQNGVLDDLTNLRELTLSHNRFTEIPNIRQLKQLVVFDISFNAINMIDSMMFEQLTNLELIEVSHNKIGSPDVLSSLLRPGKQPILKISLVVNRLRGNVYMGIVLYGNPWHCETWDLLKTNLIEHQSECDLRFFSSGKTPYCINYRSATFVFDHGWEEHIDRFHKTIKESMKLIDCYLTLQRYNLLYPVGYSCVA
ncbi:leucine-rich repeat-containing protein egg-6-like [Asbolus verrucosus]|uniref:Leucine-rich repeat-containing protein egg-6-like n=1 Tax=Asbolus verrucosus TaxID=1661398 RepID=A0A482VBM9_ASBVE|nr:leucine-rich repeat-containing protein egg-6-like [Asbolus verrucosus]